MRDEKTAAIIHEKAAEIMEHIREWRLYGDPIDLLNPDEIIYWAYLFGRQDELSAQYNSKSIVWPWKKDDTSSAIQDRR